MPYLLKSEPDGYSFSDLEHDRETLWDGVKNPAAIKNLSSMAAGERLVYYHTGEERQVVGTAQVSRVDHTNPKTPQVYIKPGHRLKTPITLADIKSHALFSDSPLVRQGRLSVVPLTAPQYEWLTRSHS